MIIFSGPVSSKDFSPFSRFRASPIIVSYLLLMFIATPAFAQRSVQKYLSDLERAKVEKRTMVVGTGGEYGVHGAEVFKVDVVPAVRPDLLADITVRKDTVKIPDNTFDRIILEHLPTFIFAKNAEKTFAEILRMLRPGGVLIFNDMREWTTGKSSGPFQCSLTREDMNLFVKNTDSGKAEELSMNQLGIFLFNIGFTFVKMIDPRVTGEMGENTWYAFKPL